MLKCVLGATHSSRLRVICGSSSSKGDKGKAGNKDSKATPPPRITTDSNFSLKQQLRFLRNIKKWEAKQKAAPVTRQRFRKRRNKDTGSDTESDSEDSFGQNKTPDDLAREALLLSKGRGISSLYDTKTSNNPPAVLVDGYNILMAWIQQPGDKTRKRQIAHDFSAARDMILKDLSDYSGWRRFRMMVAFDASNNVDAPKISRSQMGGVEVVFVGRTNADTFVITEAQQLRQSGCPYVLVASSDHEIRDSCWADDIIPVSALQLLQEMKKARREMDDYYGKERSLLQGGRLASKVAKANPGLYQKLEQARTNARKSL